VINVEIANQQSAWPITPTRLETAVSTVLEGEGVQTAEVSVAVVDDPTIHELNHRYLNHDYPTDVLSFPLAGPAGVLDGEIVVSADTAARQAPQYGWGLPEELLLYVIHGALHLVGYDDHSVDDCQIMRDKEQFYLQRLGCPRTPVGRYTNVGGEDSLDKSMTCDRQGGDRP
jgi:probable rRNA maturation factor